MRISDWSSDVCSSDLASPPSAHTAERIAGQAAVSVCWSSASAIIAASDSSARTRATGRSEEHTSELQSLMRTSYAVFCLKKKRSTHSLTRQSTQVARTQTKHDHSPVHYYYALL